MRFVRTRIKPRAAWFDDDCPMVPHLIVDDAEPVDTGLVFADGSPVMRINDPIGFGREHEQ